MSPKINLKLEIEKLKEEIRSHDHAYYVLDKPLISDSEYDALFSHLKRLESEHPELITPDSPTQRVSGTPLSIFKQIHHSTPMLSLDNTYSEDEIKAWVARIDRLLPGQTHHFVLNPKIDGLSISLHYKNGIFLKAATRGDGDVGEDVTLNARTIKSIPLKLTGKPPEYFEVRGEIYMDRKDFEKLNMNLVQKGEEPYANPRNFAAGSLRQKDPQITAQRPLKFFAHSYGDVKGMEYGEYTQFLTDCENFGLPVAKPFAATPSLEKVVNTCAQWQEERDQWQFETDGVVIRINNIHHQKKLGTTAKSPRWAIAFKFPATQATTQILDVEHSVGRTGVITPAAQLNPVPCGGVVISNATLHNYDEIKRLGVKIGDTVLIERAGEVIPKVVKVILEKRTGQEKSIKVPTQCPSCGTPVHKSEEEVALRCPNPNCPVQIERSIIHFASRDAMDIEGMGEAVVQQLLKNRHIKNIADIYSLKKEDFLKLDLFKEKRAQNLVQAIDKSKNQTLDKLIFAFGIPNIGEKAATLLAENFGNLATVAKASREELEKISEIGPVVAKGVLNFFQNPKTKETIQKLKNSGLDPQFKKKKVVQNPFFTGKSFVFTGELSQMSRPEAQKLVQSFGGKTAGSVSSKTDYVVVGENAGSKAKKARDLGVKVLSEGAFLDAVKKVS